MVAIIDFNKIKAESIINMIQDRNMTSHAYKEEVADQIASQIEKHFSIMKKYSETLA